MTAEDKPCTLTLPDGTHYDLTSLSSSKSDYFSEVGNANLTYTLNVCRGVVSELWNPRVDDPELIGGYVKKEHGDFSIGQFNSTLFLSESGNQPMMYMQKGSPCPLNALTASSTAVRFVCNQAEFSAGKPVLIAALPPGDPNSYCQFFFEWHTHVACPTNRKAELEKEHWIAFIAIALIAVLTWFVGATFYNRIHHKKRGIDQFPIPSFIFSLISKISSLSPNIPKYGKGKSTQSKSTNGFGWRRSSGRSGGSGYSHIRAAEEEEDQGFAGRFSLDDDDDDEEENEGPRVVQDGAINREAEAWRTGSGGTNQDGDLGTSNSKSGGTSRELLDL